MVGVLNEQKNVAAFNNFGFCYYKVIFAIISKDQSRR